MPSEWNAGILGVIAELTYLNFKKLLQIHHSITSLFHYFIIPIGPARSCLAMAGGAKPLSSDEFQSNSSNKRKYLFLFIWAVNIILKPPGIIFGLHNTVCEGSTSFGLQTL